MVLFYRTAPLLSAICTWVAGLAWTHPTGRVKLSVINHCHSHYDPSSAG